MEFIETSLFTNLVYDYLNEEEYFGLQVYLLRYPDSGHIVPGTGGVRKLRWAMSGKGKRGGVRVIYFWKVNDEEIWLLTIYGKSQRDSIPSHVLKQIAEEIRNV